MTGSCPKTGGQGVLIMAGGTGGHIFPGLAVVEILRQRNIPVRWLGAEGGMEAQTVPQAGIDLDLVVISGLRGKGLARWIHMPLMLLRAVLQARRYLEANRPRCAISFGGYAAAPGGIAAWSKGIPVLVHEQNRIPGLTNRLLARIARKVLQGFPGTFSAKISPVNSGNPVRSDMAAIPEPQVRLAGRNGPVRVLVTGGSQGARILNMVVPAALKILNSTIVLTVCHQSGEKRIEEAKSAYAAADMDVVVRPFIEDMADAYAWADIVICRSGALTVAELAAAGVASILVPYAHAVDDHQTRNAEYLSSSKAAIILPQDSLDPQALVTALKPLLSRRDQLLAMAIAARQSALPNAAENVADACNEWMAI